MKIALPYEISFRPALSYGRMALFANAFIWICQNLEYLKT